MRDRDSTFRLQVASAYSLTVQPRVGGGGRPGSDEAEAAGSAQLTVAGREARGDADEAGDSHN